MSESSFLSLIVVALTSDLLAETFGSGRPAFPSLRSLTSFIAIHPSSQSSLGITNLQFSAIMTEEEELLAQIGELEGKS